MITADIRATNGHGASAPARDGFDATSVIGWADNAKAAILGVDLVRAKLMERAGTAGENGVLDVGDFHEVMRLLVDAASDRINDVRCCVYKMSGVSSSRPDARPCLQNQDPSADLALKVLLGVQRLVNSLQVCMASEGDGPAKEAFAAIAMDALAILDDACKLDRLLDRASWRGVTDGHEGVHGRQHPNGSARHRG